MKREEYERKIRGIDFFEARERLHGVVQNTSLIYSNVFSKESGNQIYIKPENLQNTGSFKIRGAYNKISKLSEEERSNGLIASSAGNHAQGVAYAANRLGVKSTIVMPSGTPLIKVEATKFTEVGYVGRDVESMIRDLTELAVNMVKKEEQEKVEMRAEELAEERLLDILLPRLKGDSSAE